MQKHVDVVFENSALFGWPMHIEWHVSDGMFSTYLFTARLKKMKFHIPSVIQPRLKTSTR